jgi:phosphoglycerate dehydrogenase-like enzyme
VVVALGAVDPTLVTEVLGDSIEFVAQPGPEDLAMAQGAIVRADVVVDAALLARAPRLRVLARTGVGVDLVDLEEASARGIAVVITPGAGTRAVAEGVLAHALHLVKRLAPLTRLVREGRWAGPASPSATWTGPPSGSSATGVSAGGSASWPPRSACGCSRMTRSVRHRPKSTARTWASWLRPATC